MRLVRVDYRRCPARDGGDVDGYGEEEDGAKYGCQRTILTSSLMAIDGSSF